MRPILAPAQADDVPPRHRSAPQGANSGHAHSVHERVLATVAARICADRDRADSDPVSEIDLLCDAVVCSEAALESAFARMRRQSGLRDEDIVDCYIPMMAHQLGRDWAENRRSFAEVTIASARLSAAVRRLGERWVADTAADWRAPNMAMIVPEAEQHRLGAMIAASRFRRLGVSVQMLLGRPDAEVVDCVRNGGFDLLSLSIATQERVEQARRLIQMLRKQVMNMPPIVVGGAVGMDADDVRAHLGADHVASDAERALQLCGLNFRQHRGAASAMNT